MSHQIAARKAHEQYDACCRKQPAFSSREEQGAHAGGSGGDVAGREGETVFGRGTDCLPPFAVDRKRLKGARTCNQILKDDVCDQSTAANGAEYADTKGASFGEAHQSEGKKEKQDSFFTQQCDELTKRRQHHARMLGECVHQTQDTQIKARKSVHQP